MRPSSAPAAVGPVQIPVQALTEPWRSRLVLALLVALLVIVGPRHEPWFDEGQAWLVGRDTTLWDLLAHRVRYEGSPGLWHALLWFLSHAGFPFSYLWVVSGVFATIGAYIILTRAPFPYWLRVGVVFSYFVAYQYAVVARSYALDLVLIPLIALAFDDRLRRPVRYGLLLGLCANANAHSFVIAGVLFAEFLIAAWRSGSMQRAQIAGMAVYLVLAGAAVLQAWPPDDLIYLADHKRAVAPVLLFFVEAFVDRIDVWRLSFPSMESTSLGILVSAVILVPSFALFRRAGIAALVGAAFAALFVFSFVMYANAWHAGVLYLVWIFALWVSWRMLGQMQRFERRLVVGSVAVVVFVQVFYAAVASARDVREPYSAGPAVAHLLSPGTERVAAVGFKTFAVQPWFAANAFANHRDGKPRRAYYDWRLDETVPYHLTSQSWNEAVRDRHYDMLLLSDHRAPREEITRAIASAEAAGYCAPVVVDGGLIWKSYVRENDAILVFRRCADDVAAVAAPR